MNSKTTIALAAVLFSTLASPSFAGDHDLAALLATSGRIYGTPAAVSAEAYASAKPFARAADRSSEMAINDRLAQGHN